MIPKQEDTKTTVHELDDALLLLLQTQLHAVYAIFSLLERADAPAVFRYGVREK